MLITTTASKGPYFTAECQKFPNAVPSVPLISPE